MARPTKAEQAAKSQAEQAANEPVTTDTFGIESIQLDSINTAPKPVTLQGKSVPMSASGKCMLRNMNTGRIITGLIDHKLAEQQVAQFKHIEIVTNGE